MEPAIMHESPRVLLASELTESHLHSFLDNNRHSALIITDAIDPYVASPIIERIVGSNKLRSYSVESTFQKVGRAWFDNDNDEERTEHIANTLRYYEETVALCHPFAPPTDTLKARLDLLWKAGVFNQRIDGSPIYYGLPRALKPGGTVSAHFDWIGFDSPRARGIEHIQRQIAVNFYLQNAESGGEVALWDHLDLSPRDLATLRIPGHPYALDEGKLGPPAVVIAPPACSLVFFDATKPHAVRKTTGSRPRVTFSSFIGYAGTERPLTLWS